MKEYARICSSKPLNSINHGGVTVGNIIFVKGAQNVKNPLLIHVDVCSKFVTGNNHVIKQLVFDCEPGIMQNEDALSEHGMEQKLKAAGLNVGLAEVTIRLIREKARATKAGV